MHAASSCATSCRRTVLCPACSACSIVVTVRRFLFEPRLRKPKTRSTFTRKLGTKHLSDEGRKSKTRTRRRRSAGIFEWSQIGSHLHRKPAVNSCRFETHHSKTRADRHRRVLASIDGGGADVRTSLTDDLAFGLSLRFFAAFLRCVSSLLPLRVNQVTTPEGIARLFSGRLFLNAREDACCAVALRWRSDESLPPIRAAPGDGTATVRTFWRRH